MNNTETIILIIVYLVLLALSLVCWRFPHSSLVAVLTRPLRAAIMAYKRDEPYRYVYEVLKFIDWHDKNAHNIREGRKRGNH
jgi:hypothetical protein